MTIPLRLTFIFTPCTFCCCWSIAGWDLEVPLKLAIKYIDLIVPVLKIPKQQVTGRVWLLSVTPVTWRTSGAKRECYSYVYPLRRYCNRVIVLLPSFLFFHSAPFFYFHALSSVFLIKNNVSNQMILFQSQILSCLNGINIFYSFLQHSST